MLEEVFKRAFSAELVLLVLWVKNLSAKRKVPNMAFFHPFDSWEKYIASEWRKVLSDEHIQQKYFYANNNDHRALNVVLFLILYIKKAYSTPLVFFCSLFFWCELFLFPFFSFFLMTSICIQRTKYHYRLSRRHIILLAEISARGIIVK